MHPTACFRSLLIPAAVLAAACTVTRLPDQVYDALPPRDVLIAHALGGIDGVAITNSADAFDRSYREGLRWFEVDLAVTADGDAVCFHPGHERHVGLDRPVHEVSTSELLRRRYDGRYTLLSFAGLLDRLDSHPDAVLVLDSKTWDEPMRRAIGRAAAGRPESVMRRVVPQVYRPEDLEAIGPALGLTPRLVIFTLYRSAMDDSGVVAFVRTEGIPVVAVSEARFRPSLAAELERLDRRLLVHTVNSPVARLKLRSAGADGFITDFLRP